MQPDIKTYLPDKDIKYKVLFLEETLHPISNIVIMDLLAEGCQVDIAWSGETGLVLLAQHHHDVVVSGMMLNKVAGVDVLDIAKNTEAIKNTKIIIHSGLETKKDVARAKKLGCDDYLKANRISTSDLFNAILKQLGIKKAKK